MPVRLECHCGADSCGNDAHVLDRAVREKALEWLRTEMLPTMSTIKPGSLPVMPRFTITAESRAETLVGATGWAAEASYSPGPAFTANPNNDSRKTAQPIPSFGCAADRI
jgi:hypothetical protein